MKTLKVLETAINKGLNNSEIDFFADDDERITFGNYLGAVKSNGSEKISDTIAAGLFIWGEENFISIADTIFENGNGDKIAYYKL